MFAGGDATHRRMNTWWVRSSVCLSADVVRRKPPGEQWSRRETVEARGTKWNLNVGVDTGIPGSRDEEIPSATVQREIPMVPPPVPPPQPDSETPEMRGQGVHAKALRLGAFWSGRTPGSPACETPGQGSHTLVSTKRIKMPGRRVVEPQQRRRRSAE